MELRIRAGKNFIGLCAVKGCFKPMKVKIEVKEDSGEWGLIKTKQRFYICHDCIHKLFE